MFRLITFFASTICLAIVVWLGLTVDLGERTLFGHLRAISASKEAEQLWDGARSKVTEVVGIEAAKRAEREREKAGGAKADRTKAGGADDEGPGTGPPQERVGEEDREGLRRIIDSKKPPAGQARAAAPVKKPPPAPAKAAGRVPPPASRPPSKP